MREETREGWQRRGERGDRGEERGVTEERREGWHRRGGGGGRGEERGDDHHDHQYLKNAQLRTKSRHFTDNHAGLNLSTNSFHEHLRLLMEISPNIFLPEKYFDPIPEYVFQ